jgi:hypothetical protein
MNFWFLHGQEHAKREQFNVYRREDFMCSHRLAPVYRRDFYKISLISEGTGVIHYADKLINIDRPSIVFMNPLIPYSNQLHKSRLVICLLQKIL